MSASKETNDINTKFVLRLCLVLAIIAIGLTVYQHAKAGDFDTPNYALTSDFIESDRKCNDGNQAMCQRVDQLCALMTPQKVRELHRYIRHDYPFKAKNGAMNITTRYIMALRKCSPEPEAGVRLTSAAVRG